jgi:hypothetical protein
LVSYYFDCGVRSAKQVFKFLIVERSGVLFVSRFHGCSSTWARWRERNHDGEPAQFGGIQLQIFLSRTQFRMDFATSQYIRHSIWIRNAV